MKKLIVLNVLVLMVICNIKTASAASDYTTFQEINFLEEGKLLVDINTSDYYHHVEKRKFVGWRVHYINKHVKVNYITDTLLDYYNSGTTAMKYEYKITKKDKANFSISVCDELQINVEGEIKKFDSSLSNTLKIEGEYEKTSETEEEETLQIDIDPKTQLIVYNYGEGYITNGVACDYVFWVRASKGGFEYFEPTTQYTKIIKKGIR